MKKKLLALALTAAMAVTTLAGCGFDSSSTGGGDTASSDSSSEESSADELNILVWGGVWSEDMFTDFTDKTGIKVNISYVANTDEIMTKLINGGADYDLIDLEAGYVQPFIENNLLQTIDHSKIPNEDNIEPEYDTAAPGDENMDYTVPDMAPGFTTIVYNKETCPIQPTKLEDLADPALKDQVALVDSTISLYGAALVALGYDPGSTDENEIKEANDLLMKIKENTKTFAGESCVAPLENGEVSVALSWDYPTLCNDSKDNWDKFASINIEQGCERFQQYWAIPKTSTKVEAAEELINFVLQPEEMAKTYEEYGGAPLLKRDLIESYLSDGYYDNPAIAQIEELTPNSWLVPVSTEQIDLMDTYYTELKGE